MKYLSIFKDLSQSVGFTKALHRGSSYLLDVIFNKICYKHMGITEDTILFSSSPDCSDNAKVLYDYMIETGLNTKYKLMWIISDKKKYQLCNKYSVKYVPRYAIFPHKYFHRCMYYVCTAKWIFHTHGNHPFAKSKQGQTYVNLWHGGMGFKGTTLPEKEIPVPLRNDFTLISGDGEICYTCAYNFFNCDVKEKYLPLGAPRNDLLFKFREIPMIDSHSGKKILWMPTFRQADDNSISSNTLASEIGLPIIYTVKQMAVLNTFLKKTNVELYIKIHPLQKIDLICKEDSSNIHFLTNDDLDKQDIQLYEILNHFDALISDYSSVSFDFLYLNRPIGYTLDDFDEYNRLRGFSIPNPLNYMPGLHIYTYEDFEQFIKDISENKDEYESERKRVMKDVGMPRGDNNCQRILEFLGIM